MSKEAFQGLGLALACYPYKKLSSIEKDLQRICLPEDSEEGWIYSS